MKKYIIAWLLAIGIPLLLAGGAHAQVTRESMVAGQPMTASSGDVAAAISTATLAAPTSTGGISPGPTWYVTGLEVTGNQATSAASVVCTVTGLAGSNMTIDIPVTVIATPSLPIVINWPGGLAANPATAVVFSCPSMGTGNLHAAISIHAVLVR